MDFETAKAQVDITHQVVDRIPWANPGDTGIIADAIAALAQMSVLTTLPEPTVRTDGTASWFDALDEDMPVWVTVPGEPRTHWPSGTAIESPDRVSLRACTDYGDEPESLTPENARRVARALLAAANRAEQQ